MNSKIIKYFCIIYSMLLSISLFAQKHRYERYDDPKSIGFGLKILLVGGAIWGFGMLIILMQKKNEKGSVENPSSGIVKFAGTFCVIGAIIAIFGLIMLGF